MWAAYRRRPQISSVASGLNGAITFTVENLTLNKTSLIQVSTELSSINWTTIHTNVATTDTFSFLDPPATDRWQRFHRVQQSF
jgi:hypothetical protein